MAPASSSSSSMRLLLLCLLGFCVAVSHQQSTDPCGPARVAVASLVPFDSTSFRCTAVWKQEDFVLRYKNTGPSVWSFILSAPDKGSYVAVGFSGKGAMVGSSAVVGWASNGRGTVKQYYLGGKSPDECTANKGLLKLVKNKAVVVSHSGRLYLAFQLSTDYPQPHLIYAVGPDGNLPSRNSLQLPVHRNMASRSFNYTAGMASNAGGSGDGTFPMERKHGLLGMMGWGVLMPIGMMTARYFRQLDPCWFYSHMAIQVAGFAVGITAIVLGFGLNEDGLKNVNVHKALGIAILAMSSLQVMAILARPDKTSKVRRFWNWYHHNIGRAAILLAIGNVFLGLSIAQEVSAYVVSYGVFVAVWVVAVAAFEIKRFCADDD
ncbi:cytochrome b561 and DOMON domain-containing protein At3g07570-like [Phragmites australis]|uniref:cytochrome b561 and DOMON domain-containing protein At3g07570-like n=1 Tax=Phragmites australis TaxID=29695 RepID=UPI002D76FD29|nr:cytochrome b561 and DOMON domain-containing protein At3g07570-like [Phragmites australis]XP_062226050.1 cytochrome b561 and DOMON domain-containing protein At3g07570-like [Phragmites australis]